ncbi:MAG TPA: hypothetical protein VEF76_11150 [Patescibacteria group bacterium]|nr:hypothetical protein [Patescibacteria group bacterium]
MSTLDEARRAKGKVGKLLSHTFNNAAQNPVNSIGISRDKDGFFIAVGLERQPTPEETRNLPRECDGVAVKYKITGPIVAL